MLNPRVLPDRLLLKHNADAKVELKPGLSVVDLANSYFVVQDLEKATGKDREIEREEREAEEAAAMVKAEEGAKKKEQGEKQAKRVAAINGVLNPPVVAAVKGAFDPSMEAVKEVINPPVAAVKEGLASFLNPKGEGGGHLRNLVKPRESGLGAKR